MPAGSGLLKALRPPVAAGLRAALIGTGIARGPVTVYSWCSSGDHRRLGVPDKRLLAELIGDGCDRQSKAHARSGLVGIAGCFTELAGRAKRRTPAAVNNATANRASRRVSGVADQGSVVEARG